MTTICRPAEASVDLARSAECSTKALIEAALACTDEADFLHRVRESAL